MTKDNKVRLEWIVNNRKLDMDWRSINIYCRDKEVMRVRVERDMEYLGTVWYPLR